MEKMKQNMHQLVALANHYPSETIFEIAGKMNTLPNIEVNIAIWQAQDEGFLTIDEKEGTFTVDKVPETWEFGPEVVQTIDEVSYLMHYYEKKENDIHDQELLLKHLVGIRPHVQIVAINKMLDDGTLKSYTIENIDLKGKKKQKKEVKSQYLFYTLADNFGKHWGLKQFKDQSRATVL